MPKLHLRSETALAMTLAVAQADVYMLTLVVGLDAPRVPTSPSDRLIHRPIDRGVQRMCSISPVTIHRERSVAPQELFAVGAAVNRVLELLDAARYEAAAIPETMICGA